MPKGDIPVLVGVGQTVSHWIADEGAEAAPGFLSLAVEAAGRALRDAGGEIAKHIDTIAMVRTMDDSIPSLAQPFGRCNNLPRGVAAGIGADPATAIYAITGGQSPQSLVNEMAARIYAGECDVALIGGTEAIGARKTAKRAGLELDFSSEFDGSLEDRGLGALLLSRAEIKHGLVVPAFFYALFENAYAHKAGHTRGQHRAEMSRLFEAFSKIASDNPYAQFRDARSAEFLAMPSKENYPFCDPYLKWHMAQDAVNMAAAVVMMGEQKADALGIAQDRRIYLHGGGEATDLHISERPKLDGSWAMDIALGRALDQAGKTPAEIDVLDLYSCFPIAVFSSTDILGIDWRSDPRALTQTGGLPFFGGPGNNYSLHGIASVVEALRQRRDAYGLVLANGGWMTKEAAGVYSAVKPETFMPADTQAIATDAVKLAVEPSEGVLETFTVVQGRDGPSHAIAFGRTSAGERFIATSREQDVLARLNQEAAPIGAALRVTHAAEVNTFKFA